MERYECDVLIIGCGAAGSRAAYEAKKAQPSLRVLLVYAAESERSGSSNLDASEALGINAPLGYMGDGDGADVYYSDIIATGGGLADPKLCRIIADESTARIEELIDLGVDFERRNGGIYQQKLSGCSKARSLACGGGTGREICRVLVKAARNAGVEILKNARILALCRNDAGSINGALGEVNGKWAIFLTGSVLLASGGAGSLFEKNVNPSDVCGDSWGMAYDAGAKFVNMEFFQTGPAVMFPHVKFIIHSHVWRMNPKLVNNAGDEFLKNYCPAGMDIRTALELKAMSYPFSVRTDAKYVDIAIFSEVMAGRGTENMGIYFDVTHVDKSVLSERMPITYKRLKAMGVDPSTDRLQLGLAVQNFNGGILIDSDGFTGVQGLYAAGEASGGVHGSDRPGGNNLTDTQVFGFRAGRAAAAYAREIGPQREEPALSQFDIKASCDEAAMAKKARELFYRRLTVIRNEDGLREVLRFTEQGLRSPVSLAMRNCLTVGRLLARAMLARKESRGTHYREDHPGASGEGHRYILRKNGPDVAVCEQKWSY